MNDLTEIKVTPKTGQEVISDNGAGTDYTLLDFWRWSVSDLVSNATRGQLAEFIVGTAIGLDPRKLRVEWDSYDLKTSDGIKIEVKSAAYIQTWSQRKFSNISFSIKPARHWEVTSGIYRGEAKRHADVYVFCLLKHQDQATLDPLRMEQWEFYVLPTCQLDGRKRISLGPLRKLTTPVKYGELSGKIKEVYKKQIESGTL